MSNNIDNSLFSAGGTLNELSTTKENLLRMRDKYLDIIDEIDSILDTIEAAEERLNIVGDTISLDDDENATKNDNNQANNENDIDNADNDNDTNNNNDENADEDSGDPANELSFDDLAGMMETESEQKQGDETVNVSIDTDDNGKSDGDDNRTAEIPLINEENAENNDIEEEISYEYLDATDDIFEKDDDEEDKTITENDDAGNADDTNDDASSETVNRETVSQNTDENTVEKPREAVSGVETVSLSTNTRPLKSPAQKPSVSAFKVNGKPVLKMKVPIQRRRGLKPEAYMPIEEETTAAATAASATAASTVIGAAAAINKQRNDDFSDAADFYVEDIQLQREELQRDALNETQKQNDEAAIASETQQQKPYHKNEEVIIIGEPDLLGFDPYPLSMAEQEIEKAATIASSVDTFLTGEYGYENDGRLSVKQNNIDDGMLFDDEELELTDFKPNQAAETRITYENDWHMPVIDDSLVVAFSEPRDKKKDICMPICVSAINIARNEKSSMLIQCLNKDIIEWDVGGLMTESLLDVIGFGLKGKLDSDASRVSVSWRENKHQLRCCTDAKRGIGALSDAASSYDEESGDSLAKRIASSSGAGVIAEAMPASTLYEAIGSLPEMEVHTATLAYLFNGITFSIKLEAGNTDIEVSWMHPMQAGVGLIPGFVEYIARALKDFGDVVEERSIPRRTTKAGWLADREAIYKQEAQKRNKRRTFAERIISVEATEKGLIKVELASDGQEIAQPVPTSASANTSNAQASGVQGIENAASSTPTGKSFDATTPLNIDKSAVSAGQQSKSVKDVEAMLAALGDEDVGTATVKIGSDGMPLVSVSMGDKNPLETPETAENLADAVQKARNKRKS